MLRADTPPVPASLVLSYPTYFQYAVRIQYACIYIGAIPLTLRRIWIAANNPQWSCRLRSKQGQVEWNWVRSTRRTKIKIKTFIFFCPPLELKGILKYQLQENKKNSCSSVFLSLTWKHRQVRIWLARQQGKHVTFNLLGFQFNTQHRGFNWNAKTGIKTKTKKCFVVLGSPKRVKKIFPTYVLHLFLLSIQHTERPKIELARHEKKKTIFLLSVQQTLRRDWNLISQDRGQQKTSD